MAARVIDDAIIAELVEQVIISQPAPAFIEVFCPYDGCVLGKLPSACETDVTSAVLRARGAQGDWAKLPIRHRTNIFLRFHDLLLRRQDEVLDLIQLETGKARRYAFEEVLDTAAVVRYYALHGAALLGPRRRRGAIPLLTKAWEFRFPIGVVGFIIPWNYPLNLGITDAAAALIAGNTGVLRPDPQASLTVLWAVKLLREAGLPPDVLPVITGDGAALGAALCRQVDFVMFTGSSRTGRIVGREAAERLIGFSLELGGKNPLLVLADADVRRAVDGAVNACFVGAGQVCVSVERIYAHESLYQQFLERFIYRTSRLKIGAALDYSIEIGSLASMRQLSQVEAHVQDAVQKGASLLCGGRRRPDIGPLFYEPTVLSGIQPDMRVFAEETFGPVVSVFQFSTDQEAIDLANATPYGLSASIWTRRVAHGLGIARQIRAGSVNINEGYAAAWGSVDAPSGGMKDSGIRPRHGAEGILKYTDSQTVAAQRVLPIGPRPGVDPAVHARWMTRLLGLVKMTRILG